jgi:hypothetical protein
VPGHAATEGNLGMGAGPPVAAGGVSACAAGDEGIN